MIDLFNKLDTKELLTYQMKTESILVRHVSSNMSFGIQCLREKISLKGNSSSRWVDFKISWS